VAERIPQRGRLGTTVKGYLPSARAWQERTSSGRLVRFQERWEMNFSPLMSARNQRLA